MNSVILAGICNEHKPGLSRGLFKSFLRAEYPALSMCLVSVLSPGPPRRPSRAGTGPGEPTSHPRVPHFVHVGNHCPPLPPENQSPGVSGLWRQNVTIDAQPGSGPGAGGGGPRAFSVPPGGDGAVFTARCPGQPLPVGRVSEGFLFISRMILLLKDNISPRKSSQNNANKVTGILRSLGVTVSPRQTNQEGDAKKSLLP